jgi:aralkylamine N-acetyltransferase
MIKKNIEIRIVDHWPEDEIVELYKAGGWWKESYEKSGIPDLIKGSFAFAVVIDTTQKKAIGMGRVLSDGISDAYIQDVVVYHSYRKQGLGGQLVQKLVNHCISHGILWIALIAEPGTSDFYIPHGFKPMEKYTPMLFSKEL